MVSTIGQINKKTPSNKDSCDICERKSMVNAILCKSCESGYIENALRLKGRHLDLQFILNLANAMGVTET